MTNIDSLTDGQVIALDSEGISHADMSCPAIIGTPTIAAWPAGWSCGTCIDVDITPRSTVADRLGENMRIAGEQRARTGRPARPAAPAPEHVPTGDDVEAFLTGLGRKVEPGDITPELQAAATAWAADYTGDFQFMVDMRDKARAMARQQGAVRMLTTGQAKGVLNCWRADLNRRPAPKPAAAEQAPATEITDGIWTDGTAIFKVQIAKNGSGNLYAKRFDADAKSFEYEAGLIGRLRRRDDIRRMTADEASAFGHLYGCCVFCSRDLTDERSIDVGYGATCAAKNGLSWG